MEKRQRIQKYKQSVFSVFNYFAFFVIIFYFYTQKNTNAISQKYKVRKKYEPKKSQIQNAKNTNPKFQKYKIQKNTQIQK